ncbi:MAG: metallophosphoesterase, partial [Clostridia bacterium]
MNISKVNDVTTIKKEKGKPFRILQLTDIHIGGGILSVKPDKRALDAVEKIVKAANADFIIVTGDIVYPIPFFSGTRNNLKSSKMFGRLMEKLGVPWTFVFGNHDSESFAKYTKDEIANYYMSLKDCLFEKGEKGITGLGNYSIKLVDSNDNLIYRLMFVDSNAYLTWNFFSGFDIIHADQTEWYKRTVATNDGKVEPSLAFFHIPPKEFKDGWEKCYMGSPEAQYHLGFVQEKDNYFGYPKTVKSEFFSEMVKLGSCRGMFMGHDHLNTLSITYQGIRL